MRKLKNIYKALMAGLLLVILSSSCTKELREQEYGKQEKSDRGDYFRVDYGYFAHKIDELFAVRHIMQSHRRQRSDNRGERGGNQPYYQRVPHSRHYFLALEQLYVPGKGKRAKAVCSSYILFGRERIQHY